MTHRVEIEVIEVTCTLRGWVPDADVLDRSEVASQVTEDRWWSSEQATCDLSSRVYCMYKLYTAVVVVVV